jgi:hypothetical protein
MWDMYKNLPSDLADASRKFKTIGRFRVKINGTVAFDNEVVFWNYRQWRFWPTVDIQIDKDIINDGKNYFEIENLTKHFEPLKDDIPEEWLSNTSYQVSSIELLDIDTSNPPKAPILPEGCYTGHLIEGHDVAYIPSQSRKWLYEMFLHEGQGNLIVIMFNPGKLNYDVNLDKIDTEWLKEQGLYVALRYYGEDEGATIPPEEYANRIKRFAERLGDNFIGFGPHEQHGIMSRSVLTKRYENVSDFSREHMRLFKKRTDHMKELKPNVTIWDTDPSAYSGMHLRSGADYPGIEFTSCCFQLTMSSARGTAKGFNKDKWYAINSFECQAFGGLGLADQDADLIPNFLQMRLNLWWLSQFMLYASGARIIYSESGAYDHRVTKQFAFDSEHLLEFRNVQNKLVRFMTDNTLTSQPVSNIAYLQGKYDIFKLKSFEPALVDAMGSSIYTWKMLNATVPQVAIDADEMENFLLTNEASPKREMFSDTPFGDPDVVPIESDISAIRDYKVVVLSGWNTMEEEVYDKLYDYVYSGGTLVLHLPQMTKSTRLGNLLDKISEKWLKNLCGIKLKSKVDSIPLNKIKIDSKQDGWDNSKRLIKRQIEHQLYGMSLYGTRLADVELIEESATHVMSDKNTGAPFIIENKVGAGKVFLINEAEYSKSSRLYEFLNNFLTDIFTRIADDFSVVSGRDFNFYIYNDSNGGEKIVAFMNDWYSERQSESATIRVNEKEYTLNLKRNEVTICTL